MRQVAEACLMLVLWQAAHVKSPCTSGDTLPASGHAAHSSWVSNGVFFFWQVAHPAKCPSLLMLCGGCIRHLVSSIVACSVFTAIFGSFLIWCLPHATRTSPSVSHPVPPRALQGATCKLYATLWPCHGVSPALILSCDCHA